MKKQPPVVLIFLGLMLIAAAAYFVAASNRAGFDYDAVEIFHDQPLYAVHEMSGSTISQIPFSPANDPQPSLAPSEDFYDFGNYTG